MKRYIAIVLIFLAYFCLMRFALHLPTREALMHTGFAMFGFLFAMLLDK